MANNVSKSVEESLSELGLNKYESRVYLTLVAEGVSTAKNISDITGIPYGKVYEIIDALCNKGFVMTLPTKPMKCRAIAPKEALKSVKKNMQTKLANIEKVIIDEMEPMFAKTKAFVEPKGIFWILNGRSIIYKKAEELVSKAEKYIHIYTSEKGLRRVKGLKQSLRDAKKRGVKISISGAIHTSNKDIINALNFCERKHITKAPSDLFLIDGKECLLVEPIPDDESIYYGRDIGVWILNQSFSSFMGHLFESQFDNAQKATERLAELK